jgi:tRNA A37 methylthiotransferase MiaB
MKVYFTTNGFCANRNLDITRLGNYFKANGATIVKDPRAADYIVLVTCAYKKYRADTAFSSIKTLSGYKGELIVAGCLPAIEPARFKESFKGRYITTKEIGAIDGLFPEFKVKFSQVPDANIPYAGHELSLYERCVNGLSFSPAFLKKIYGYMRENARAGLFFMRHGMLPKEACIRISDGCLGSCSYCAIKFAVGRLKSKPLKECAREYRQLLSKGYRIFNLVADDLGAYGQDIQSSFAQLLDVLSRESRGLGARWKLTHFHPIWAIKYQENVSGHIASQEIFDMQCPVQSGSERILKLMSRYSNRDEITRTLQDFKKANKNLYLRTQIIAGFPSETDEDFLSSLDFIKVARFNHVQIFPYYDGQGTAAERLTPKIDFSAIVERVRRGKKVLEKAGIEVEVEKPSLEAVS